MPGASELFLLSASSAFVKHCMIQNKGRRGHRSEVLHVRHNQGILAIVILKRIGRPLGEIFIFLPEKYSTSSSQCGMYTFSLVQFSTSLWTVQSRSSFYHLQVWDRNKDPFSLALLSVTPCLFRLGHLTTSNRASSL